MKKMRVLLAMALLACLTSCSSIRMRYDAQVKTEKGKASKYTFEKSYDVGSTPVLCGLTAIFLGGACWYYLVMPTANQVDAVLSDASEDLDGKLGSAKYEVAKNKVSQKGWGEVPERSELVAE